PDSAGPGPGPSRSPGPELYGSSTLSLAMPILKVAQIGHPVLRQKARDVGRDELLTPAFQAFIDSMVETMRDAGGAGLAANQVHEPVRVCVIEVADNPRYPYKPNIPLTILINPVLTP